MKFTQEEVQSLKNFEQTAKPLIESSSNGWHFNTHSLEYKGMASVYKAKYNAALCNTCPTDTGSKVKSLYREYYKYMRSLENEPKELPVYKVEINENDGVADIVPTDKPLADFKNTKLNIEELRAKYKAKYNKNVSNKYKNNAEWIESKL